MAACAILGCRRSAPVRGRSTRFWRRADPVRRGLMRWQLHATSLMIVASSASAQQPPPAENNVRSALERIARIDPQLRSVIAIDPTAIDQARRIDTGNVRGPLAGQPVLIKD